MNVLLVTNQVKTYAAGFRNVIEPFLQLGHRVVWAANFSRFEGDPAEIPCEIRNLSIAGNPLKPCNLRAYRDILRLIDEEKIDAVYCSTPIGGTLGRLAAHKKKIRKVIYAAHGFLFFDGVSPLKKMIFRLHEKILARRTDVLITITEEDYRAAKAFRLRPGGRVCLVHGAGVELGKTLNSTREEKRRELEIPEDAFVLTSAGFLTPNKNNRVLIRALSLLRDPHLFYLVCGEGGEEARLKQLAHRLGVADRVRFLGFRRDVAEIMAASDLFVMPSFREGVPRALLEAMDLGLACVGSRTRGVRELIGNEACLCSPKRPSEFAAVIETLRLDPLLRRRLGEENRKKPPAYSSQRVRGEMLEIIKKVMENDT